MNFHLSINISPIHFLDENFIPFLFAQLQKFKLPTHMIDLEITENLAIENTEQTKKKINILKEKGIQKSMDDFGTGYTSLTYLSQFNLDRIKIDRSFIKELPKNKNDAAIVQSLLFVAKNLNISVTAEGVEKEEQLNALLEWGCDEIQGYYYSRPLPEDKLLKYWQETVQ
ncbi:Phytochrome-like protein cph2 [Bacillus sp. T2.9-1]|nr:Phytochrome-like protein cph2 [Bacillus sp. T2.9-1]